MQTTDPTPPRKPGVQPVKTAPAPGEEEHLRVKIAGGLTARVLLSGDQAPTRAALETLIKYLELAKDQYPDDERSTK